MSGTSLDGVDAVLVTFEGDRPSSRAHVHQPFPRDLRDELLALNSPGDNEVDRAALAGNALARHYADAVAALLQRAGLAAHDVEAVGCHGQTIRHRPDRGYTVQIGNAALLAELAGIRVVSDFRSRDVAAGGQGAPLAPAFHAAVFGSPDEDRAILNLGGIANLTFLRRDASVGAGFDTGPASCLMDLWASRHLGQPYDAEGAWAAGGRVLPPLLDRLLADPYFALPPPKSTGRDLFNAAWLDRALQGGESPRDVQATLLELTARTVAEALRRHFPQGRRLLACGGGTRNGALMSRISAAVHPMALETTSAHGIDPQHVEAAAFAWLARQTLLGRTGNLPTVTGARGLRQLGTLTPPNTP